MIFGIGNLKNEGHNIQITLPNLHDANYIRKD